MLVGSFYIAPVFHVMYSKIYPFLIPNTNAISAVKKLILDQGFFAPVYIASFFPVVNFVSGNGFLNGIEDLKYKYVPAMKANYKFWPII